MSKRSRPKAISKTISIGEGQDYHVRIAIRYCKNGYVMWGSVIDGYRNKSGKRISVSRRLISKEITEYSRNAILKLLEEAIKVDQAEEAGTATNRERIKPGATELAVMVKAILEENDYNHYNWQRSTYMQRMTYLINRLIPAWQKCRGGTEESTEELLISLAEKSKKSKKSTHACTVRSVQSQIRGAIALYRLIREEHPELPELDVELSSNIRVNNPNQFKELPDEVYARLTALLVQEAEAGQTIAFCALMMLLCGLRPGEAAAIRVMDVKAYADGIVYYVDSAVKGKMLENTGKNSNAFRYVFGPSILSKVYMSLKHMLEAEAKPDEEIGEWLFFSRPGTRMQNLYSNVISAYVKEALLLCGCTEKYLAQAEKIAIQEEEEDGRTLSAYLLRRNFDTKAHNYAGLSFCEIGQLMGHGEHVDEKADNNSEAKRLSITQRLEKMVLPKNLSDNPSGNTFFTEPGNYTLCGNSEYFLSAPEAYQASEYEMVIEIAAAEPRESLCVISNGRRAKTEARYSSADVFHMDAPTIALPSDESVSEWIRDVANLKVASLRKITEGGVK